MGLLEVPRAVADPSSERLGRSFWWLVAALTAGQIALRGWAAGSGWFFRDDFWWHDIVARSSLLDVAGLSLGGHYSPLTYVPYWIVTDMFPYEWTSRVIVMLVTLLGINAGVLAVVRRLWPSVGPQVAVYFLWALSSLAAPSWLWYSQFSMTGALLLTSTWTLWAYLRALATDRVGHKVTAIVLLTIAMFSQERMAVTALLMVGFLFLVCRPSMPDLRWGAGRGLWVASATVVLVWAVVYRSLPVSEGSAPSLTSGLTLALDMIRVSALPALLGGPWVLERGTVLASAATPVVLQVLSAVGVLALIAWSTRHNRLAIRAWLLLGVGIVVDAAAVTLIRGATYGEAAVGDWRYFSDLAVMGPILMVAAFVPPGSSPTLGKREVRVMAVCLCAFGVSSLFTSVKLGVEWHRSSARPVLEHVRQDLDFMGPVVLLDRVMPNTVVGKDLLAQRLASRVLSIIAPPSTFDAPSSNPMWIDDDGRLVPGDLSSDRSSVSRGPCAYLVEGTQTVTVELTGPVDPLDWGIRIDYLSQNDLRVGVTDFARTVVVDLPAGRQSYFVPMPGVGGEIGLFLMKEADTFCVESVVAGEPGPAARSQD